MWGGIIVLLVLVGIQARARFGYTMTLNALQDRIAQDEGPNPQPLLVNEVDGLLVGWPKRTDEKPSEHRGLIHLSWRGLTTSYGMTLPYDPSENQPAIMGLETSDAPPEPEPEYVDAEAAAPSGMAPGASGPPMGAAMHSATPGGPPGQGGGRDPMANDADGDGKLSREEAQGRIAENFDAVDANADGFAELEEINAWREANPRPQADNPDRPAADDSESTDSPTPPATETETPEPTTETPESATESPEAATESPESATDPEASETPQESNAEPDPATPAETESPATASSESPETP